MINILLAIVSLILAVILFPIGLLYAFLKNIIYYKGQNFFLKIGLSNDILGNTICEQLFNDLLITKVGYRFGDSRETISSVLGKNQQKETLTRLGFILAYILDSIETEHCKKSIKIF